MKRDFSRLTSPEKALESMFEALKERPLRLESIPVYLNSRKKTPCESVGMNCG